MDLAAILKKTKAKSDRIKTVRKPPSIATDDRPYSISDNAVIEKSAAYNLLGEQEVSSHPFEENTITISEENAFETISTKTSNKLATNRQQSSNKVATNQQQSGNQSSNKLATNQQQTGNTFQSSLNKWQQSGNQTSNTTGNKVATNWQQTSNKVATKTTFSELVGLQRDIIHFIYLECKNLRSKVTEALTLEHIAAILKHSTGAIRTTLQRLEKKGCLIRVGYKNGRGGWSKYELPDYIYHDALRSESGNKVATNQQQSGNKVASKLATELATSPSSSSSYKETTTTIQNGIEQSDAWNFEISIYKRFGFTETQLKQLKALGKISAAEVEQSLIEFNFDYENNSLPHIKTGKINFLMGLFRAGHTYVSESFKTEQELMIAEMARRREAKQKSLLNEEYEAWIKDLSVDQKQGIEKALPPYLMVLYKNQHFEHADLKKWLFDYFFNGQK